MDLGWRPKRDITLLPLRNETNCHEPDAGYYTKDLKKEKVGRYTPDPHRIGSPAVSLSLTDHDFLLLDRHLN
jgi:hypothetical protein